MATSETPPPQSHYQFRIRDLLIATVVVAVVIAITAPFARDFTQDQWMLIGTACAGFVLGAGVFTVVILIPRRYARNRAGRPLIEPIGDSYTPFDLLKLRGGVYVTTILVLEVFARFWIKSFEFTNAPRPFDHWFEVGIFAACLATLYGRLFAPPVDPQLCENGLLWGAYFIPWKKLKIIRGALLDPLYLRISYFPNEKVRIRADQREQVEAILRERCPSYHHANVANPEK